MTNPLLIPVGDLIGSPGKVRPFSGDVPVHLRLGETTVDGTLTVRGSIHGLLDAVRAEFLAGAVAHLTCTRCLTEWDEQIDAMGEQYFSPVPDDDGYSVREGHVDVGLPATDEFALALPSAPLCRPDCLGLCPTCGTDLNSDPCDGHDDDSDSPFAVLRDLFDS